MFSYSKNSYISEIMINNELYIDNFTEVLNKVIKEFENVNGKRKQTMDITVMVNNTTVTIQTNKRYTPTYILRSIIENLKTKLYFPYNYHLEPIDYFDRFIENISGYSYENDNIVFKFKEKDYSQHQKFIKEISEWIEDCKNYKEHIKSISPDFKNYLDKRENLPLNVSRLNKYIDILIKYSDILDLDKYKQISCRYRYSGDMGTSSRMIKGDIDSIKYKFKDLINQVYKYSHDIIDIYPADIDSIDIENLSKTDFLYFSVMENDNCIAVHKYLDEERSKGITNYYASKKSGDYTGD